jgi:dolichol-phosphate mannosyltransferase
MSIQSFGAKPPSEHDRGRAAEGGRGKGVQRRAGDALFGQRRSTRLESLIPAPLRSPMRPPDLTVVVPTYNEREHLEPLVDQIQRSCAAHALSVEVIIVDDNSPDGTGRRAEQLAESRPVRVIHRPGKLGLGSAVLEGFAAARGSIVGVMDADLSHPPQLVPIMYDALRRSDVDVVVGSRYVRGGRTESWPMLRLALSRLGCWTARPLTPVRDAMSGFFLMRRERALNVGASASGFKIGLELLVKSRPRSIVEVGYKFVGRRVGSSKMNLAEAVGYLRQVVGLYGFARRGPRYWPRHRVLAP